MDNQNNKQNIPVSILIESFKNKMSEAITTSGLPASVLELLLENFYKDIKILSSDIYKTEKIEYEKSIKTLEESAQNNE